MNKMNVPGWHWRAMLRLSWLLAALALLGQAAHAEQKVDFGLYEVHYSAFNSTFLTPEVARQYGIVRSRAIGVVNISVLKKREGQVPESVEAQVEGIVSNDIAQQIHLPFRRVREGQAIYSLAEFQFSEGEVLTFQIRARVNTETQPMQLRFANTFYSK